MNANFFYLDTLKHSFNHMNMICLAIQVILELVKTEEFRTVTGSKNFNFLGGLLLFKLRTETELFE